MSEQIYSLQQFDAETGSCKKQSNTSANTAGPALIFNQKQLSIRLNGSSIKYQKQILTSKGLEINSINTFSKQQLILIAPQRQSIQFDKKFNQTKYCVQLANTIDRATNSIFYLKQRRNRTQNKSQQPKERCPESYSLQICQYIMKKVPNKPKCFQLVFRNIPLQKIPILLENDKFYIEVINYFFNVLFKFNVNQVYVGQKQPTTIQLNCVQQTQNSQQISRKSSQNQKDSCRNSQRRQDPKLTSFQKKVIKMYQGLLKIIPKFKKCFQRINLLLTLFTRQARLNTFLYELNRQIIAQQMSKTFDKVLSQQQNGKQMNLQNPKTRKSAQVDKTLQYTKQNHVLDKIIAVIKTIHVSVGKTQISSKLINDHCLKSQYLSLWLKANLQNFQNNIESGNKLIEFISLISQFNIAFVNQFFDVFHFYVNRIVGTQARWIYETIHTFYSTEQQQQRKRNIAERTLDNLIQICKATIKQNSSPVNFGRCICKNLCEFASNLRPVDIQLFAYICSVNIFSRSAVLKYLFAYFRKFIRNLKSNLRGSMHNIVNVIKKNRHQLLQIIQSIRIFSQIDSIDFTIDYDIMNDIQKILEVHKKRAIKPMIGKGWRGDCLTSAYQAMLKNVKIEKSKQNSVQMNKQEKN